METFLLTANHVALRKPPNTERTIQGDTSDSNEKPVCVIHKKFVKKALPVIETIRKQKKPVTQNTTKHTNMKWLNTAGNDVLVYLMQKHLLLAKKNGTACVTDTEVVVRIVVSSLV